MNACIQIISMLTYSAVQHDWAISKVRTMHRTSRNVRNSPARPPVGFIAHTHTLLTKIVTVLQIHTSSHAAKLKLALHAQTNQEPR